jgi:hypothetical protein
MDKNESTCTNTDNMGKLFVMVFAAPCSHDKSCQNLHPDTRTCLQLKSCTVTDFWLRSNLYRDTAQVLICNICYILTDLFHLSNLYRDTPGFDKTCTWICKNHAIPSFSDRMRITGHSHNKWSAGIASGNTTSPYCRAVSTNAFGKLASHRPMINYLDIVTFCHLD